MTEGSNLNLDSEFPNLIQFNSDLLKIALEKKRIRSCPIFIGYDDMCSKLVK